MATSNSEMIKKIIIGTVSTILAGLVIYYVIERGDGDRERKQATLKAWDSYNQNKDIFSKIMNDLGRSLQSGQGNLGEAGISVSRDIDMSIENMENIKRESNVDNRMLSLVDIKTSQLRDLKQIMALAINQLSAVMQSNLNDEQSVQYASAILTQTSTKLEGIRDRDKLRISSFRSDLCKEYGSDFCQN